ncbi:MAG: zf-HC2 domain-containing protein [Candidatus Aureabacteria bacterium]|nr:zf-HC2 domain-containing protein [Candidatus Auribacterota bacterium]
MMDCRETRSLFARLLRGELPPESAAAVRRHAVECDYCRAYFLILEKALSRLGERSAPPGRPVRWELPSWERKAPLFTAAAVLVLLTAISLRLSSCAAAPKGTPASAPPPAPLITPSPLPAAAPEAQPVRLRQSQVGSVLVLEEEAPSPGGEPAPAGDYDPFQDHVVKLYVPDVSAGLPEAVNLAQAGGAQAINYPVKGFENLGPNERILVFDIRTYRPFLEKLKGLGRAEYLPLVRSDYVTVRLTVLSESVGTPSPSAPVGIEGD